MRVLIRMWKRMSAAGGAGGPDTLLGRWGKKGDTLTTGWLADVDNSVWNARPPKAARPAHPDNPRAIEDSLAHDCPTARARRKAPMQTLS